MDATKIAATQRRGDYTVFFQKSIQEIRYGMRWVFSFERNAKTEVNDCPFSPET